MQGAVGAQGAQGVQGAVGAQVAQGAQGVQGAPGFTGSVGAQGVVGAQGAQGRQGAQGAPGFTGSIGAQGSNASASAPLWRHVTSGFQGGGQVFVGGSTPTASAAGDIWLDTTATGYTQNLSATGWTRLPNGVIFQWGTTTALPNRSNQIVTFPTAFTSVGRAVMTGVGDINVFGQASKGASIYNVTATNFTYMYGDDTSCTAFWIAMGY